LLCGGAQSSMIDTAVTFTALAGDAELQTFVAVFVKP